MWLARTCPYVTAPATWPSPGNWSAARTASYPARAVGPGSAVGQPTAAAPLRGCVHGTGTDHRRRRCMTTGRSPGAVWSEQARVRGPGTLHAARVWASGAAWVDPRSA